MRPMAGVRVLEVGRRLGVASAGLALNSLGAEVAQVRAPGRDLSAEDSVYYDRGRLTIGWDQPLSGLGRLADVVLTDLPEAELAQLGLPSDEATLRSGDDAQLLVSIRSLGRSGPNRDFRMTDLTEWAAGGLATVTRRPHSDLETYVPVLPPGSQPQALAGLAAAIGVVAGQRWARGRRQPVVVDVSVQEAVAAILHGIFPNFVWNGIVTGHPSTSSTALGMLLPAADGDVYIRTLDPLQWDSLMGWVDNPEWSALGATPDLRLANNLALRTLLGEWTATRGRADLLVEGQRRRVPIALPRSLDDVLAWQHLRARGVWRTVDLDGTAAEIPRLPMMEPTEWSVTRARPSRELEAEWSRA